MRPLNALAERQVAEALRGTEPEPGPAEALFLAYVFFGLAAWLAWARLWRWW